MSVDAHICTLVTGHIKDIIRVEEKAQRDLRPFSYGSG
jgi:hypothetical protein